MSEQHKCCVVRYPNGIWHGVQCGKMAKVERDGEHYCTVHDPVRRAENRAEHDAKWEAEWNAKQETEKARAAAIAERDRKAAAYDDAQAELDHLRKENAALREALELAVNHLDWIGWGDSWERECVRDNGDMAKINAALQGAKDD